MASYPGTLMSKAFYLELSCVWGGWGWRTGTTGSGSGLSWAAPRPELADILSWEIGGCLQAWHEQPWGQRVEELTHTPRPGTERTWESDPPSLRGESPQGCGWKLNPRCCDQPPDGELASRVEFSGPRLNPWGPRTPVVIWKDLPTSQHPCSIPAP